MFIPIIELHNFTIYFISDQFKMPKIITTLLPLLVVVAMMGLVQAQAGGKGRCDIDERVRLALRTMNSATVRSTELGPA